MVLNNTWGDRVFTKKNVFLTNAKCIFMANLQEAKYDTDSETPPTYDNTAISEIPTFNTHKNNAIYDISPHNEQHSETPTSTYDHTWIRQVVVILL